jgi:uncharacterized protein (TIGR00369 family)
MISVPIPDALVAAFSQQPYSGDWPVRVNYLKPVRLDAGPLSAAGTVVKSGARVGFTECVVTDASGKVVATATSTLLVFDL